MDVEKWELETFHITRLNYSTFIVGTSRCFCIKVGQVVQLTEVD